jgi:DNA-binding NarL/FixJ family response regulator
MGLSDTTVSRRRDKIDPNHKHHRRIIDTSSVRLPQFPGRERLTGSELLILDSVLHGFSNKATAIRFKMSHRSVEVLRIRAAKKLLGNEKTLDKGLASTVLLMRYVYGLDQLP